MKNAWLQARRLNVAMSVLLCIGAVLMAAFPAAGAEYFVGKQGKDANTGLTGETAFLTIQKGVNALKPGDTLTIGPGEYFENVSREGLGGPDADTVIRAEIPGTVMLHGDVPAPEFTKVDGYRFVYAATFEQTPMSLLEHDTLTVMTKRPNVLDVEYEPGAYCYDAAQKKLYMSTSDMRAPGGRRYTVVVSGRHRIELTGPQRVIIDGLAAGRCAPGWGIILNAPVSCTVRNCIMLLGEGGICLERGGSNNVIENCESYGHTFGGIVRYYSNNDIIRNCRTYRTKREGAEHFGIMHYHDTVGPLLIQNNISWGQDFNFSVKPSGLEKMENCVALGPIRNGRGNVSHNLVAGDNEFDRDNTAPADSILFMREKALDQDLEFADPLNLDFRLQADSRFRGTAPDKSDRGPYQYEANVFYVSQNGDDNADGLSMRKSWRTLERALRGLRPGDTVYLAEGEYAAAPLSKAGDGKSPIMVRARGQGAVFIKGGLDLSGVTGVVLERLNFSGGAALEESSDITFNNCAFSGTADGLNAESVKGLRVTHAVFTGVPLALTNSSGVYLSGNLYANAGKAAVITDSENAILYSDYNNYQNKAQCWAVNGATLSFADVQKRHDIYSQTLTPEFVAEKSASMLLNADGFKSSGPHSTRLGNYREFEEDVLRLTGPILHSVSDTTANIEWWTSSPATFELSWGETPEMSNKVTDLQAPDRFTTFSLTGLKPGTTYHFKIVSADATGRGTGGGMPVPALKPSDAPLTFTTSAVAAKPAVFHVAPDGDDARSGLGRQEAWRTVTHAADTVNAGDTVLIAGGEYRENVRIRATGDAGKPVTFRCAPGERVVFNGRDLLQAFKVIVKKNVNFDGFYFEGFGDSMSAVFVLWRGDQVKVTRCFNVKGTGNVSFISAALSADLLVKNCVAANGFSIARLHFCPNLLVENNVLMRPWIMILDFVNKPEDKGIFRKNVLADNQSSKTPVPLFAIGRIESFGDENNCYFLRVPDEQRRMFQFYGTMAYVAYARYGATADFAKPPVITDNPDGTANNPRMSLKQFQDMVGDTGSFVADPKFAGAAPMEPGTRGMSTEWLMTKGADFPDLFATDPKVVERGIGLIRDDFKDFWFNKK